MGIAEFTLFHSKLFSDAMKNSRHVLVAMTLVLYAAPMYAQAQALGHFLKGFVEQANRQDEAKARQQALEFEQQRLQLLHEQQRMEIERQRQAQLESERRRQAELQAQIEAQQREEQARAQAYRRGYTGSGFFVSKSGHIITNAHVLGEYRFIIAKDSDGKTYELDVLAIDEQNDLALLQAAKKTEGLPIMPAQSVAKGLKVYAIGYPQPGIQGTESKITDGLISSMTGLRNDNDSYQISVPIQAGNSGGPLVTDTGAVVGVIVATVNARKFFAITGDIPQNVNFAIKPDILGGFMKANNVTPLRLGKPKANPLGFADQNTVMIAARPERFDLTSVPSPSGRSPSPQVATPTPAIPHVAMTPEAVPDDRKKMDEPRSGGLIRCQVGTATPVMTTKEKCDLVNGKEIP